MEATLTSARKITGQEFNPFCLPPEPENFSFLYAFVRMLLESDGGPVLTNEEMADLFSQVQSIYQLPRHVRRLGNLRLMPYLDLRLGRWICKGGKVGQYAHLFDNEEDTITTADIQAFSFPQIKQDREAVEAMLFYTLHRSLQRIWATDRPGFVFFDEAVSFLQHPATRAYILDALLSFQKRNASIILFIHSLANMDPEFARKVIDKLPHALAWRQSWN